jgi:hypothetical protein
VVKKNCPSCRGFLAAFSCDGWLCMRWTATVDSRSTTSPSVRPTFDGRGPALHMYLQMQPRRERIGGQAWWMFSLTSAIINTSF